jgi:hypothetical protein
VEVDSSITLQGLSWEIVTEGALCSMKESSGVSSIIKNLKVCGMSDLMFQGFCGFQASMAPVVTQALPCLIYPSGRMKQIMWHMNIVLKPVQNSKLPF